MWVLDLLLGLGIVLVITAATGYFVAQEFGFMAVDRSRLNALAARGDVAAERALSVTRRTSFMLSGAQLGITITALLVGYVAEPFIGEAIGEALGGVDVDESIGITIGTIVALLFSTFVQMLFGELFPKNLAIARPEPVALWLARSTTIYLGIFGPLIKVFDAASNALLRAFKMEPVHDVEHAATARDLEHIVADSRQSGDLPAELSVLLDRVLDFPEEDVEHAMVPRSRVDTVAPETTVAELWHRMSTGHSRYPVLDGEDEVVGVVHLQDVLVAGQDADLTARDLMRESVMVATLMGLPDALRSMAAEKAQMAIVLDEYGGYDGVLTSEDLAEELVGEIEDEHDPRQEESEEVAEDGTWTISGDVHVDEVERTIGRELPTGDFETVGGLVIAAYGGLPEAGESVDIELPRDPSTLLDDVEQPLDHLHMEVLEIDRHVPSRVRMTLPPPDASAEQLVADLQRSEDR